MTNNELVIRWRKTGLLEDMNESLQIIVAQDLQRATDFLITKSINDHANVQKIAGIMLPIIVRLARDRQLFSVNVPALYIELKHKFSNFVGDESEACCKFVEDF